MAKMQSFGLDAVAVQLKELGQQTGPVAQRMLEAGAGELKALWRKEISTRGHVDTGDMLESVDATEPKKSADGLMIEVYPQGNDRKGVSNAEKAYLLHYGWKGRATRKKADGTRGKNAKKGDHFVDAIEKAAPDLVQAAMEKALDRALGK